MNWIKITSTHAVLFAAATLFATGACAMQKTLQLAPGTIDLAEVDPFTQMSLQETINAARNTWTGRFTICVFYACKGAVDRVFGYSAKEGYDRWCREHYGLFVDPLRRSLSHVVCYRINICDGSCVRDNAATYKRNFDQADAYYRGVDGVPDYVRARHLCKWLLDNPAGGTAGQQTRVRYMLACICYSGDGEGCDYEQARYLCNQLVDCTDTTLRQQAFVRYMLACMCYHGHGGGVDYVQARRLCGWLVGCSDEISLELQVRAHHFFGCLCYLGLGGERDYRMVKKLCAWLVDHAAWSTVPEQEGVAYMLALLAAHQS